MIEEVLKLTDSEHVELADSFKKLLHTELVFGMTKYVCRNGTLSDGHERITEAQIYYQALREAYNRAETMRDLKCAALEAHADHLDAVQLMDQAVTQQEKLRSEAKLIRATASIQRALVQAEDCKRQLDEFLSVVNELQDKVRLKYPGGIEQAEPDNWKAVAEYRASMQEITGVSQHLSHLPLPMKEKAELGLMLGKAELVNWYATEKKLKDRSPDGIRASLHMEKKPNEKLLDDTNKR